MKAFAAGLFILLFCTFLPFSIINYGWSGLVASILWTIIMMCGLGGALVGNGLMGGLVGVVFGWIIFAVITTIMGMLEWLSGHPTSEVMTDKFAQECFAGQVIHATTGYVYWVFHIFNTEHPHANGIILGIGGVATLIAFIVSACRKS